MRNLRHVDVIGFILIFLGIFLSPCSAQDRTVYDIGKNFENLGKLRMDDPEHWKVVDGVLILNAAKDDFAAKNATVDVGMLDYQIDVNVVVGDSRLKDFATTQNVHAGIIFRHDAKRAGVFYLAKPCNGWAALATLEGTDRFRGKETFKGLSYDTRRGTHHLRAIVKGDWANFYVDNELCCVMNVSGFSGTEVGLQTRMQASITSFTVSKLPYGTRIYKQRPVTNLIADLGKGKICPGTKPWQQAMADTAKKIDKAVADGSPDVVGMEKMPNYVYRCVTYMPAGQVPFYAYPAFHHSIIMNGLLNYYDYSKDKKYFDLAIQLADWELGHMTPADCYLPNMPYSTTMNGKMGGNVDGDTIMLDKAGIMGTTYLRIYRLTNDKKYLDGAVGIAETLLSVQKPEGRWQNRVRYDNGDATQDYTSNQIFNIVLMDGLYQITNDSRYDKSSKLAFKWLMDNPVKSWRWTGYYEDVAPGDESIGNWDAIETARYLILHRNQNPAYLKIAHDISDWVATAYCVRQDGLWPFTHEQSCCMVPMNCHTLHYAQLLNDLYKATGDSYYRDAAISATNAGLSTDNEGWYSLTFTSPYIGLPLVRELNMK